MSPVRVRLQFTDALGAGQSFEVADGDVCGRDPSVNLLFDHPTVSRRHARFTIVDTDVDVTDLGSANGTFVNGKPLDQRPYRLSDEDQLRFGHLQLRVIIDPADDATAPAPESSHPDLLRTTQHGGVQMEPQLLMARIAQRRMVSDPPPQFEDYDIGQLIVPALGVGGDFIHWAVANDGRQAVVMGEVSGKGVAAGMYMAFVSGLLFEIVPHCGSAEEILRRMNRALRRVIEPGLSVTASTVLIDPRRHVVELGCAGHPPGLIKQVDGKVVDLGIDSGRALGRESEPAIGLLARHMAAGEVLMVSTDKVEEAQNPAGQKLGHARVIEVLSEASGAADAARRLHSTIREFVSSARQQDDLTLVTIERIC